MSSFIIANLGDNFGSLSTQTLNASGDIVATAINFINNTSMADVAITLSTGLFFVNIKDVSYTADLYPITITPTAGLIEGESTYTIGTKGGWNWFSYDGSNYWVIG